MDEWLKEFNLFNFEMQGTQWNWLRFYDDQGADELVFLDISASNEGRKTMVDVVRAVASESSDSIYGWRGN